LTIDVMIEVKVEFQKPFMTPLKKGSLGIS
jgi:hypothetical protein